MSDSDLLDSASDPYPQSLTLTPVIYPIALLVGLKMGFVIHGPHTYNFCHATCCFLEQTLTVRHFSPQQKTYNLLTNK